MTGLLDDWNTPERPGSFTSEPHRLVMYDDPDDGFGWEVLHPDTCERERVDWGDELHHVSYACDVAYHVDAVGINDSHIHAFDEFLDLYKHAERLLPGTYTMWVTVELYKDHENWLGGLDADSWITVEPQRAIERSR